MGSLCVRMGVFVHAYVDTYACTFPFARPLLRLSHQTYQRQWHRGTVEWNNSLICRSTFQGLFVTQEWNRNGTLVTDSNQNNSTNVYIPQAGEHTCSKRVMVELRQKANVASRNTWKKSYVEDFELTLIWFCDLTSSTDKRWKQGKCTRAVCLSLLSELSPN